MPPERFQETHALRLRFLPFRPRRLLHGRATPWGNGTSSLCVVPPVKRMGLLSGSGSNGACNGSFAQDLNAHWQAQPPHNPGAGAVVQAQLWYRDPLNSSNQTTSLSDAIEFSVGP